MSKTASPRAFLEKVRARHPNARFSVGGPGVDRQVVTGLLSFEREHRSVVGQTLPYFNVLYLLEGRGIFTAPGGEAQPLSPGSFLVRPARTPFSLARDPSARWTEFVLDLPAVFGAELLSLTRFPASRVLMAPLRQDMLGAIANLFDTAARADVFQVLSGAFGLFARLGYVVKADRGRLGVEDALTLLRDHPPRDVAEKLGLSYDSFRKAFVSATGMAPTEYRIRLRTDAARECIRAGDEGFEAIARRIGYPDYFSFAKQFKRVTGMTPGQYRDSL